MVTVYDNFCYYIGNFKELEVFRSFYKMLANILPAKNISPDLISASIITIGDSEEIAAITKSKDRASFVLDKVARSLEVGITCSFYSLLTIMDVYGGDVTILATEIKDALSKFPGTYVTMYVCTYVYNSVYVIKCKYVTSYVRLCFM